MDEKTFPFRLDKHTRSLISSLIGTLASHDARLQSLVQGRCSILFDKKHNVSDVNVSFTQEGIMMEYGLKSVASMDKKAAAWLNQYHAFLSKQKNDAVTPVLPRCFVTVKATYSGTLHYFLTYMVQYPDNSIAQDTPQGALYATEGLFASSLQQEPVASQPAGQW